MLRKAYKNSYKIYKVLVKFFRSECMHMQKLAQNHKSVAKLYKEAVLALWCTVCSVGFVGELLMMFYGRNLGQEMVTLWVHAGDDLWLTNLKSRRIRGHLS